MLQQNIGQLGIDDCHSEELNLMRLEGTSDREGSLDERAKCQNSATGIIDLHNSAAKLTSALLRDRDHRLSSDNELVYNRFATDKGAKLGGGNSQSAQRRPLGC